MNNSDSKQGSMKMTSTKRLFCRKKSSEVSTTHHAKQHPKSGEKLASPRTSRTNGHLSTNQMPWRSRMNTISKQVGWDEPDH